MNNLKLLSALSLLVFFTACAQQKALVNDGLVINSLIVDPPELESYSGTANIFAEIENVGGTTATDIKAYLLGASWLEQNQRNLLEKSLGQMQPYDIRTGAPGEVKLTTWTIPPAELPEGVFQDYKLIVRVEYDYATNAVANIPAVNEDEYVRKKLRGESLDPIKISNANAAPVVVDVVGQPIIVRKRPSGSQDIYFFKIFFVNTGSGVPFDDSTGTRINGVISGTIKVQGAGATFDECFGQHAGSDSVQLPPPTAQNAVVVRRGESALVPCAVAIDHTQWTTKPEGTVSLIFELDYRYFTDAESSIRILGRIKP